MSETPEVKGEVKTETTEAKPAVENTAANKEFEAKLAEMQKQMEALNGQLDAYKQKEQEELDKQKTAEQKLAEKEQEISKLKREKLLFSIGVKKGLDPDLFDRVRGDDESAIEADIDLLLTKFAKPVEPETTARGTKAQPKKAEASSAAGDDGLSVLERRQQAFSQWRDRNINRG